MSNPPSGAVLIALAYLGFVSLGLPDGLLGVATPSIRESFQIGPEQLGALLIGFTAGYLLSSAACGALLARLGVGALLAWSCLFTAASLLVYSVTAWWWLMVAFGAVSGLGAGAIDAGLNTWVATHHRARTVNWLHAFYGVGATSGPLIMTAVMASGHAWRRGYAIVGVGQLVLAAAFAATRRLWPPIAAGSVSSASVGAGSECGSALGGGGVAVEPGEAPAASAASTLRLPLAWLGIGLFFLYTGLEAATGVWAFSLLTSRRVSPVTAGAWVSAFWFGLTAGRLLFGAIVGLAPLATLLRAAFAAIVAGATLVWLDFGNPTTFFGLALTGFAMAPVFPSMIATTSARLGSAHTANGVGFQVAAASLGGSLIPAFVGVLVGRYGLEALGPVLVVGAAALFLLHELPGMSGAATAPRSG